MERTKIHDKEAIELDQKKLRQYQKEMKEIEEQNRKEDFENTINQYIEENWNVLTTGDAYALNNFLEWVKNK